MRFDRLALLQLLADGRFHSGQQLAAQLGVSRGAIWKALKRIEQDFDLELQAVRGRGYRLEPALEFLQREQIRSALSPLARALLSGMEVHTSLDSTNRYLGQLAAEGAGNGQVVLAEHQQAGRGRRGRSWVSPLAQNLYLSLLWRFDFDLARLSGLSLAVAVAVARALTRQTGIEAELKWPNDILFEGKKLGGILLEAQGESEGPCAAVIGIGLNLNMSPRQAAAIDQPWTDLRQASGQSVSRNALCVAVLDELVIALLAFAGSGLESFMADWRRRDALAGSAVRLRFSEHSITGRACGIDEQGALLLETSRGRQRYLMGEVSLRREPGRPEA